MHVGFDGLEQDCGILVQGMKCWVLGLFVQSVDKPGHNSLRQWMKWMIKLPAQDQRPPNMWPSGWQPSLVRFDHRAISNKDVGIFLNQGLILSIWFKCPSGMWFWKFTCPAKISTCSATICASLVKLVNTAGKICTCPDWKITCPVGHVTTKVYVPCDKIYIYMPRACGHILMSIPNKSDSF